MIANFFVKLTNWSNMTWELFFELMNERVWKFESELKDKYGKTKVEMECLLVLALQQIEADSDASKKDEIKKVRERLISQCFIL